MRTNSRCGRKPTRRNETIWSIFRISSRAAGKIRRICAPMGKAKKVTKIDSNIYRGGKARLTNTFLSRLIY